MAQPPSELKTALRTDDHYFDNLPDYPFTPHYVEVEHPHYHPLRMHYIDEGPKQAEHTLLLAHGCPSWSYLYRKVIPPLVQTGFRVIAPDHIGCGRSDKLLARQDYSYDHYVKWFISFIETLDLNNITLVCQDWGGPISLRSLAALPQRFQRVVVANTLLPNCQVSPWGIDNWPGDIINHWINFTRQANDIIVSDIIQGTTTSELPKAVLDAYDAPFPDASYKQGILNWPSLIPTDESKPGVKENRHTWEFLQSLEIPLLTAFSDQDPTTSDWEVVFQQRVKGAQHQNHQKIIGGGHMLQEDCAEQLAKIVLDFIAAGCRKPG